MTKLLLSVIYALLNPTPVWCVPRSQIALLASSTCVNS
jgi:hypothetical protein